MQTDQFAAKNWVVAFTVGSQLDLEVLMLKLALYLVDDDGEKLTPIVGREIPIARNIDIFQLPELAAFIGTEMLKLDFLNDMEEPITNKILLRLGELRERTTTVDLNEFRMDYDEARYDAGLI